MGSTQPIRRVAIIGAGPSGLATAKYLLAENYFLQIDIFEQRNNLGGIWNLSPPTNTAQIPIPQTDPGYGNRPRPDRVDSEATRHEGPSELSLELESPLYDYLETNIPKELMVFSDKPLPGNAPLFIGHEAMLQYLEEYAETVKHLVTFDTQVSDVRETHSFTDLGRRWEVTTTNLHSGSSQTSTYDAVAVANGHYTIPFVPDYPGLRDWHYAYPGSIIHSKAYRRPQDYAGQRVLIIGNSVSGLDIAFQLAGHASKVLLSSRSASILGTPPPARWREDLPAISCFCPASPETPRAVKFTSGYIATDISTIIFATGYFYNYPFLRSLSPPITTHGLRTEGTYKHLFWTPNPTLAFLVLNLKVIPLPLTENQAAVISRIWSGRLTLPPKTEMSRWEKDTISSQGSGKDFHLLRHPLDAQTLNDLYAWAAAADRRPGLENRGVGKLGTFWDDRLVWMRSQFPRIKAAYAARGEERGRVRTVEELGFSFERYRLEEEGGDKAKGDDDGEARGYRNGVAVVEDGRAEHAR